MGGTDKLALRIAGVTLLDRVLSAAAPVSERIVVVGQERPTTVTGVVFVQELPADGGPVPAVKAGLAQLPDAKTVLVLAGDLPLLTADALTRLLDRLRQDPGSAAAAAADGAGRPNPLLAAYRADTLRRAADQLETGAGVAASQLLPAGTAVIDLGPEATLNVNSPADLERAVDLAGLHPPPRPNRVRSGRS